MHRETRPALSSGGGQLPRIYLGDIVASLPGISRRSLPIGIIREWYTAFTTYGKRFVDGFFR